VVIEEDVDVVEAVVEVVMRQSSGLTGIYLWVVSVVEVVVVEVVDVDVVVVDGGASLTTLIPPSYSLM
jgi:hypothetical protein